MKYLVTLIGITFFLNFTVWAETVRESSSVDSLSAYSIDSLLSIADTYSFDDGGRLLHIGIIIGERCKADSNAFLMAKSYQIIGLGNYYLENYDKSIGNYLRAFQLFESKLNNEIHTAAGSDSLREELGKTSYLIAEVYQKLNNYSIAHDYLIKSLDYYDKTKNKNSGHTLNALALNYYLEGKYRQALKYFNVLIEFYNQKNDSMMIAGTYNNMGMIYYAENDYSRAFENYFRAYTIYRVLNNKRMQAVSLFNLANVESDLKKFDKKLFYLKKADTLLRSVNFKRGIVKVLLSFAHHYIHIEPDGEKALKYLAEALKISEKEGFKDFMIEIYQLKVLLNEQSGNYKKALQYEKLVKQKQDTLFKQNIMKIGKLRQQFENERYEKEKAVLQNEMLIKNLKIEKQESQKRFLIIFLALLGLLLMVIINRYLLKIKSNKMLKEKTEQLEQAINTKNKFFSILSHDMKNPLSVSGSLADMLDNDYDKLSDDQRKRVIKVLKSSTKAMYSLLENLLNWSLTQLGKIEYQPIKLNLYKTVLRNISFTEAAIQNKKLKIKLAIDSKLFVFADENMLSLIIRNLISNAIKFSHEGGLIQILSEEKANEVVLAVWDEGIGMTDEKMKNLFLLQTNHLKIGNENGQSTGLGLILCKEFVEKNGGSIWVEKNKEKGMVFRFTLPKYNPA